jgi:uncharacterized membrane protein YfcA
MTPFDALVFAASLVAGAIAAVAGFGVGSLLTPLVAAQIGTKLAVAAVTIPHFVATALRFWMLRRQLARDVLLTFGVTSALGGLAGALLHTVASGRALTYVLAALLLFAGLLDLIGVRLRFSRAAAWIAGGLSGFLGGLVGNQGGIRAGALLSFDLSKEAFVATSTAIGLLIDGVRLPVYLATEHAEMLRVAPLIAIATTGAVIGTLAGRQLLGRIPERQFRRVIAVLLIVLAIALVTSS